MSESITSNALATRAKDSRNSLCSKLRRGGKLRESYANPHKTILTTPKCAMPVVGIEPTALIENS
jgi:hypothetical protein